MWWKTEQNAILGMQYLWKRSHVILQEYNAWDALTWLGLHFVEQTFNSTKVKMSMVFSIRKLSVTKVKTDVPKSPMPGLYIFFQNTKNTMSSKNKLLIVFISTISNSTIKHLEVRSLHFSLPNQNQTPSFNSVFHIEFRKKEKEAKHFSNSVGNRELGAF